MRIQTTPEQSHNGARSTSDPYVKYENIMFAESPCENERVFSTSGASVNALPTETGAKFHPENESTGT